MLSTEEHNTALRNEHSEVADELVAIGGPEQVHELNGATWELGADWDCRIELLIGAERAVWCDLERSRKSIFGAGGLWDGAGWEGFLYRLGDDWCLGGNLDVDC